MENSVNATSKTKTAAIHTLGCRANQLESSIIADSLAANNWIMVDFKEKADVYIINTCTVTAKSDEESLYFARRAKRTNPNAKVVLCGCYAQVSPEEAAQYNEIDFVLGNSEKLEIADFLSNVLKSDTILRVKYKSIKKIKKWVKGLRSFKIPSSSLKGRGRGWVNKIFVSDIAKKEKFTDKTVLSASGRTRATIKIQDGCNYRCSYCIIPSARGKSRSNKPENILKQIKIITEKGFREVVLSGIHLGQWGLDLTPKSTLAELIVQMETVNSLSRFRLSSIDPVEFSDDLIDVLERSKKFCPHLHISLQSGDNSILKAMNRRYSVEYYSELINTLVKKIPDLAIGSDIIAGFPSESDEQFLNTLKNLEKLPICYIHVFPYSKRKDTPASRMSAQVPENTKKSRVKELKELAAKKNFEFRKNFSGRELEVLVEISRDKKTGLLRGLSGNFIPILLEGGDEMKNKLVKVQLTEVNHNITIGKFLS